MNDVDVLGFLQGDRVNIQYATAAGGMEVVRAVLERHTQVGNIQEHALLVYRSLTFNRDDNQVCSICGLSLHFLLHVERSRPAAFLHTFNIHFFNYPPFVKIRFAFLQRDVIRLGILTLAIQAMKHFIHHVGVQSSGCMLIQNITWLVEENRALVESSGGLVCR